MNRKTTSIAFTGDISFTKYFKDAWKNGDLVDAKVLDFLRSADHVVANVECALSNDAVIGTGLKHASDPAAGGFIRSLGANIWTVANNHILDCGKQGLLDTLETARSFGCRTIGAGVNKEDAATPVLLDEAGGIGIFSVVYDMDTLRTEENDPGCLLWNETERIRNTISAIKAKHRWCVMVVHGGRGEFSQIPLPFVRTHMKSFLKMGVDVIVAHHPHVVQNYERFGKKMIFYSLGNFIFDTDYQRIQKYTEYGMLLKLTFTEEEYSFSYQPTQVDRENHRIIPGEKPAIFCEIKPLEYHLLSDLAIADYLVNDRSSRMNINAVKYGAFTPADWDANDVKRLGEAGARRVHRGRKTVKLGLWKLARKELYEYIGKGIEL